jgi:DNA-binding PadR family transcriptional regulator
MQATDNRWQRWLDGSSWRGPLLALLLDRPGSSEELRRRLADLLSAYWTVDLPDMRWDLEGAESVGLVASSEDSVREGRGSRRRTYSATELTAEAASRWIETPVAKEGIYLAMRIRFLVCPEDQVAELLRACDRYELMLIGLARKHNKPFPVDNLCGIGCEMERTLVVTHVEGDLEWLEEARALLLEDSSQP